MTLNLTGLVLKPTLERVRAALNREAPGEVGLILFALIRRHSMRDDISQSLEDLLDGESQGVPVNAAADDKLLAFVRSFVEGFV